MDKANTLRLSVHIQPNASRNQIVSFENDELKVRIAAPPVEGKANAKLVEYLSDVLDVPKSKITIERGLTGKHKVLSISEINSDQLKNRICSQIRK